MGASKQDLLDFLETGDYSILNPELFPNGKKRPKQVIKKPGRNDLCICGSGKKYKKCCGGKIK